MRTLRLWLLFFMIFSTPLSAALREIDATFEVQKKEDLSRLNSELNFWDEIIHRELRALERRDEFGERGRTLSDLEIQVRDLRGDLLRLEPASEAVWHNRRPDLESQLKQLRQSFRDLP